MQYLLNLLIVSGVCLVIALVAPTSCDPSIGGGGGGMGDGNVGRPSRPQVFTSPEELRSYLEQLSNYYAIQGRPRFGKRLASPYRPSLKDLLSSDNSNSNSNSNSGGHSGAMKVSGSAADALNYRYPSANSDMYQLLYQYDE